MVKCSDEANEVIQTVMKCTSEHHLPWYELYVQTRVDNIFTTVFY